MAVAFSPDAVLIAEAVDGDTGLPTPLVCRSVAGDELWRTDAGPESSVPWMTWHPDRREWIVIEYDFSSGIRRRQSDVLVRFAEDGEVLARIDLGPHGEYALVPAADRVVAADGAVRDFRAGTRFGRLPFGA